MKERPNDRGLIKVARANLTAAKRDILETDEVWVNFALFNISQAVEKTIKYLCSCNGIDYDYGHYVHLLADQLRERNVFIPDLVYNSLEEYGKFATRARYTASQLTTRGYVDKHIECVDVWISDIEKQISLF